MFNFKKMSISFKIFIILLAFFLFLIILYSVYKNLKPKEKTVAKINFGATFSIKYAQSLGLEPSEVIKAVTEELNLKYLRVPLYWDLIEPEQDKFDFKLFDELIKQAKANDIQVILAIGRKLPRWPECHQPAWTQSLNKQK